MWFKCRAWKGGWLDPPVVDPAAGVAPNVANVFATNTHTDRN